MARNGPFLRLLAAFTIVGLGPVLQGAMFPFFMQHVVGDTTSGPKILLVYYPTVALGILVIGSLLMLVGNILSDIIYALVDPRIRFQ